MTDESSANRRTRIRTNFLGVVRISSDEWGTETAECENLSLRGVFAKYYGRLRPGDLCRVEIVLSDAESSGGIVARGRVARRTEEGLGVEFLEMEPESFIHLERLLEWNSDDADKIAEELTNPAF